MQSDEGKRLAKAKPEDASALLELSPTALLFGAWHSTGEGGGLGAKFARCLISEIVAIDVPVTSDADVLKAGEHSQQSLCREAAQFSRHHERHLRGRVLHQPRCFGLRQIAVTSENVTRRIR